MYKHAITHGRATAKLGLMIQLQHRVPVFNRMFCECTAHTAACTLHAIIKRPALSRAPPPHLLRHVLQQVFCTDLVRLHPQQLLTGPPQVRLATEQVLHDLGAGQDPAAAAAARHLAGCIIVEACGASTATPAVQ
jgi:hypothetical protein